MQLHLEKASTIAPLLLDRETDTAEFQKECLNFLHGRTDKYLRQYHSVDLCFIASPHPRSTSGDSKHNLKHISTEPVAEAV